MQKRKKNKHKKGRFSKYIILLLLLTSGIISLCLFTPFFNVAEVGVSGNTVVSSEEIMDSSGIILGTNVFRINAKEVKKNLSRISLIDGITIKRRLPARIDLIVSETAPQFVVPYMTGYVLLNEHGKVIELRDDVTGIALPLVSGIEITKAKTCENVSVSDEVSYEMVMEAIRLFKEKDVMKLFRSLDFSNISNFNGYTIEGVKVIFGKMADLEYKISFLQNMLPSVEKVEGTYIDISSAKSGIYGNIEEKPQESEAPEEESPQDADGEASAEDEDSLENNETEEETSAE